MKWLSVASSLPKQFDVPGVYAISHQPSGYYYVGSSVCCRSRLHRHLRELRKGEHFSKHLQRAWEKYTEDEFYVGILEEVPKEDLIKQEQLWIDRLDSYNNGFNGRPKAEANYGMQWTAEQNEARKKSNKTSWADPKLRESLSQRFKGTHRGVWSPQSHEKVSQTLRQRHKEDPTWRIRLRTALSNPIIEKRRSDGISASLKNPAIYEARIKQLRKAALKPSRVMNLRETYFKIHQLEVQNINSSEELDASCTLMYRNGSTLREIGKHFGFDHKSIAARLKRLGIAIEKRYAKGEKQTRSKLSDENIRNIRMRSAQDFTNSQLASEFKVSTSVISEIRSGKAWKHVK